MIFSESTNLKPLLSLIRYRILVVDHDITNRTLLEAILRSQKDFDVYSVEHASGTLDYLKSHIADVVLINTTLPDADGYALCSHIKTDLHLIHLPILLFAGSVGAQDRNRAVESGAEDIVARPFQRSELMLRLRNLLRLKSLQDQVSEVEHIMYSLSTLIEARDNYTNGHAERVAGYMERLGHAAGLADQEVQMLRRAAYLKDIGKAGIPDDLLNSSAVWTEVQREKMTDRLIMPSPAIQAATLTPRLLPIIRHCRENYDGTGYPDQLIGDQIPLGSRLLSIADSYDAMVSERPFRDAMSVSEAVRTLRLGSGKQWDPLLVELFVSQAIADEPVPYLSQTSALAA